MAPRNNTFVDGAPGAAPPRPRGWRRLLRAGRRFVAFVLKMLVVVVLFTIAIFFDRIVHAVHSGHLGVHWQRFGGGTVLDRTYGEGMHITWPWDEFYIYDVRVQHFDQETLVYAQDGLEITARTSIRFRPTLVNLPLLHQEIGPDYVEKIIRPESVSTLRKVLGNYTPEMIYSKDEEGLLAEIGRTLRADLNSQYFEVAAFLVLQLELPRGDRGGGPGQADRGAEDAQLSLPARARVRREGAAHHRGRGPGRLRADQRAVDPALARHRGDRAPGELAERQDHPDGHRRGTIAGDPERRRQPIPTLTAAGRGASARGRPAGRAEDRRRCDEQSDPS
jgi:regulator of protease activity HflC (stomatin/prohibitin superfamily)